MQSSLFWLILGSFGVALEAFGVSGIGLLFAGLSALCVALIVQAGLVAEGAYIQQLIWFFGLTTVWAALLWKPVKRFHLGSGKGKPYSNIVGETAVVTGAGLYRGQDGQVQWSGTLMRARLAADEAADTIAAGAEVLIAAVEGNTLYVKRKG